ncbi:MAG: hypothetical protein ACK417_10000 [Bacteroidia bacterium]
MKNQKSIWLLFLGAGLMIAACKKEETPDPTPPAPTRTEMLSKMWKPDTVLVNGTNATLFFANLRVNFNANGQYILNDPFLGSDTGQWVFRNSETQIVLDPGMDEEVWDINTLTATKLKVRIDDPDEVVDIVFSPAN